MITDYGRINGIVLSYPSDFGDPFYRSLTPFYDDLIKVLPRGIRLALIVSQEKSVDKLRGKFPDRDFQTIVIEGFNEIWLRDIFGFSNGNKVIKPLFRPTYFKGIYTTSYLERLESQTENIIDELGFEIEPIALAWDGGNLIHNNKIGFITDKVLRDNRPMEEFKIRALIEGSLEITPVFVPTAKNDQLAHTDGYLNFVREKEITLSNYPNIPFLKDARNYRNALLEIIEAHELQPIEIWDRPFSETINVEDEFLESSRGIYNNFIQLNGELILPSYSAASTTVISKLLEVNRKSLDKYFSAIHTVNSDQLARLGGVLRCVSWCW